MHYINIGLLWLVLKQTLVILYTWTSTDSVAHVLNTEYTATLVNNLKSYSCRCVQSSHGGRVQGRMSVWEPFISTFASTRTRPQVTHLFEAEGHGEHAHSDDAVHHVHDKTPVGRRHFEPPCWQETPFDKKNVKRHVDSSSLKVHGAVWPCACLGAEGTGGLYSGCVFLTPPPINDVALWEKTQETTTEFDVRLAWSFRHSVKHTLNKQKHEYKLYYRTKISIFASRQTLLLQTSVNR